MSAGAALLLGALFAVGLGVLLLFHHREAVPETTLYKGFFTMRAAGMPVIVLGVFLFVVGLMALGAPKIPKPVPESDPTVGNHPPLPPAPGPTRRSVDTDCCFRNCKNGDSCLPCDVSGFPFQIRVAGVGYSGGGGVIDLGNSSEFSDVSICVGQAPNGPGGCVPLTDAVRRGGAAVPGLPTLTQDELQNAGLNVEIRGSRNSAAVSVLTSFTRRLTISAKNVCSGYRLSDPANGGYFASIFLTDARPE